MTKIEDVPEGSPMTELQISLTREYGPAIHTQTRESRFLPPQIILKRRRKVGVTWLAHFLSWRAPESHIDRELTNGKGNGIGVSLRDVIERMHILTLHAPVPLDPKILFVEGYELHHLLQPSAMLALCMDEIQFDWRFPWAPVYNSEALAGFMVPSSAEGIKMLPGMPWRLREALRFTLGIYERPPWPPSVLAASVAADHYAHISLTNEMMIAFTPNDDKGQRDIQVRMKPGRYLTKFYKELTPDQVHDLQARCGNMGVMFAKTAKEIVDIYTTGPHSCMAYKVGSNEYDALLTVHPCTVYGDSDLQLAYIVSEHGKPTARGLVWPARKIYGRLYGDQRRLAARLAALGYRSGPLQGARIRRIEVEGSPNAIVMPYLDNDNQTFDVIDDDWCCIDAEGPYESNAHGIAYLSDRMRCDHCGRFVDEDDTTDVNGDRWCESCVSDAAVYSEWDGVYYHQDDCFEVITRVDACGNPLSADYRHENARRTAFYCDATGRWYCRDAFEAFRMENSGETWVDFYFHEHGVEVDGLYYSKDDAPEPEDAGEENADAEAAPQPAE
ncbi:MAG: hypothetical protein ACM31O_03900 [Bacteroidota bacterium]